MKTHKKSIGIALFFFNLGTIWEWMVNPTPQPFCPQERNPVLT
jgi:hypothetical protein